MPKLPTGVLTKLGEALRGTRAAPDLGGLEQSVNRVDQLPVPVEPTPAAPAPAAEVSPLSSVKKQGISRRDLLKGAAGQVARQMLPSPPLTELAKMVGGAPPAASTQAMSGAGEALAGYVARAISKLGKVEPFNENVLRESYWDEDWGDLDKMPERTLPTGIPDEAGRGYPTRVFIRDTPRGKMVSDNDGNDFMVPRNYSDQRIIRTVLEFYRYMDEPPPGSGSQ